MGLVEEREAVYDEREINFRETVQPGAGISVIRNFSQAGKITKVMFHFPPGCAAPDIGPLVDMRLEKDRKPFYPMQGFLAMDNATPVYHTSVAYYAREPLTLTIQNRDGEYPHTVTCTVVIRFKQPSWWT
ncbi:hypothetical protein ES703_49597 [subsurface metagenome]